MKLTAVEILEMIGTGYFGSPNSLMLKEACDEWPQVRPAIQEVLDELKALREAAKQWEPEWKSIAEANAAGYNEAMASLSLPHFADKLVARDGDTAWFRDGNGRVTSCVLEATSDPFHESIASIKTPRNHIVFSLSGDGELLAGGLYKTYSTREAVP